ncbi:ankyrin repeat and sam domain containing protein 6 [Colletotrichum camelliae]|nr:ankyrin repeat and sam domain containing protein 6 [Colletotrichum camelliae]
MSTIYTSLRASRREIRLISIRADLRKLDGMNMPRGSIPDGTLTCIMQTLSLKDWTSDYADFRAKALYWPYSPTTLYEDWERFSREKTGSMDDDTPAPSRFAWGDYETISYVWDNGSNKTYTIYVNDKPFVIQENLYLALQEFRRSKDFVEDRTRMLWADAICINQDDLDERATEVKRMDEIFSTAIKSTVWLGPSLGLEGVDTQVYFDLISRLIDNLCSLAFTNDSSTDGLQPTSTWLASSEAGSLDEHTPEDHESRALSEEALAVFSQFDPAERPPISALATLSPNERLLALLFPVFRLGYWTRVWIIQELTISSNRTVVRAGSSQISFAQLSWFAEHFVRAAAFDPNWSPDDEYSRAIMNTLLLLRTIYEIQLKLQPDEWETGPEYTLIIQGLMSRSSLPLDKLYGVLGLLQPATYLGIDVDYRKTVRQGSIDAAIALIRAGKSLRTFDIRREFQSSQVPSWAVDLDDSEMLARLDAILRSIPNWETDGFKNKYYTEGSPDVFKLRVSAGTATELSSLKQFLDVSAEFKLWTEKLSFFFPGIGKPGPSISASQTSDPANLLNTEGSTALEDMMQHVSLWTLPQLRLITTMGGYLGVGAQLARQGDMIYAVEGYGCPVILRPIEDAETVEFIGLAEIWSPADWDAKKGILQHLYLKEKRPMREIVGIMHHRYLFSATERMYKRQFMNWKWRKYNSEGLRQSRLSGDIVEMVEGEMACQRPQRRRLGQPLGRIYAVRQGNDQLPMYLTALSSGTANDHLSYGLLLNLHDLIQGASRQDPGGHGRARFGYFRILGRHLKALVRLGANLFDIKEFQRGGTIFRGVFQGIESILNEEPILTFRMLLLEIPQLLTDHCILRSYLRLLSSMLGIKKNGQPIDQVAQYMSDIAILSHENILDHVKRLRSLIMDDYVCIRGHEDVHSIEATFEAMNCYDDEKRVRSWPDLLRRYEALRDEGISTYGVDSLEVTRVEQSRVVATSLLMNHKTTSFMANFHEASGNTHSGIECLKKAVEATEYVQKKAAGGDKLRYSSTALLTRVKLAKHLVYSGRVAEARELKAEIPENSVNLRQMVQDEQLWSNAASFRSEFCRRQR